MKLLPAQERTYGHYPAQYDIYSKNKTQVGYHKECLYKHTRSAYSGKCTTDKNDLRVSIKKQSLSPRHPAPRSQHSRASKYSPHQATKVRVKSAASIRYMTPAATSISAEYDVNGNTNTTPKEAWSTQAERTPTVPDTTEIERHCAPSPDGSNKYSMEESAYIPPTPKEALKIPTPYFSDDDEEPPVIPSHPGRSLRRERIKSATIHRAKVNIPQRPVQSAGPTRPPIEARVGPQTPTTVSKKPLPAQAIARQGILSKSCDVTGYRAHVATPPTNHSYDATNPPKYIMRDEYDVRLKKYGWRMEVHGDPLKLKDAVRRPRLAYTVECAEPVIPPNPPKARSENFDTYFLNTIPRRKATYDIAADWASETLHAKRMALHQREVKEFGPKYLYRNTDYGFIY
ncbi:unnamed protein product [Owenia fusiformis]|uniref:Uncharacterized protein n=1 Tax=Owenia fusiformis TaxID=6347 RepID=A0A8S4Q4E7_OWEFU|nr:unnamed protein product [Owenia fusiformis]